MPPGEMNLKTPSTFSFIVGPEGKHVATGYDLYKRCGGGAGCREEAGGSRREKAGWLGRFVEPHRRRIPAPPQQKSRTGPSDQPEPCVQQFGVFGQARLVY
ncbi:hypothetical protein CCHR01_06250 [Colletotrichum chrysophilum]|uniref:Uncharacterized protein n=1 Tax=Colletotrichum chrysophilum TaxID=1836956 RepID=A0AAD9APF9_9PEZI|nr:hypothetical protein CCHR01_06250 [Colletotrichum chrysophilum]